MSCEGDWTYAEIPKSIPSDTVYLSLINFSFGRLQRANFTRLQTVECMIIMDSGECACARGERKQNARAKGDERDCARARGEQERALDG